MPQAGQVVPEAGQELLEEFGKQRPDTSQAASAVSAREAEVLQQVALGASNKEIADRLNITERTVKAHLTALSVMFSRSGQGAI